MNDIEFGLVLFLFVSMLLLLLLATNSGGPSLVSHILICLKDGEKTSDQILEEMKFSENLISTIEIMEQLLYIQKNWRSPWNSKGEKQDPWVYRLTIIGQRRLDALEKEEEVCPEES